MGLPVIVIPAYKRPESLKRLLFSISNANYKTYPLLIISIDGGGSDEVIKVANDFLWLGEKEVIIHQKNKGLKEHILFCGDLTKKYNEIIILEEDLFVSRFFYDYAKEALKYYKEDIHIGGISLYQYEYNEWEDIPFKALVDGNDTYFIQTASSWGQAWDRNQWNTFRSWFRQNSVWDIDDEKIPLFVRGWGSTSWKKYFIKYLIYTNKYFVFPRISLSTNFGDPGENNGYKNTLHQVNLLIGEKKWTFASLNNGIKYDQFFKLNDLKNLSTNQIISKTNYTAELNPLELNITEGLVPESCYNLISKSADYKYSFNLSYKVIQKIQSELPSLKRQLLNQIKHHLTKLVKHK